MVKSVGLLLNSYDDENVAVMLYFLKAFNSIMNVFVPVDLANLDFHYMNAQIKRDDGSLYDGVDNFWYDYQTKNHFQCILGIYPKEWMISE